MPIISLLLAAAMSGLYKPRTGSTGQCMHHAPAIVAAPALIDSMRRPHQPLNCPNINRNHAPVALPSTHRPSSRPSGILIHPAIWLQQTWAENWVDCCAHFLGEGRWVHIWHSVAWAESYLHTMWHLVLSSCLATIHGPKIGGGWCQPKT